MDSNPNTTHTHAELNDIARRWLLRPESGRGPGCKVAFTEVGAVGDGERADAWGYRWGWDGGSVLVESKVSRSDFLRDRHKPHRQPMPGVGLGDYRYYICPEGLINISDLPDRWGLLWVNKRGHVKVLAGHVTSTFAVPTLWDGKIVERHSLRDYAPFWRHESDQDAERGLMAYMLARVGDPDTYLQDQRAYLRLNAQQASQITALEKEARADRQTISRLRRTLLKAGLEDPVLPTSRATPVFMLDEEAGNASS